MADIDVDGSKRWDVTHIKTRDAFTHDAVIITKEHIRFVDHYLLNIRPDFVKSYTAKRHDSSKLKNRHASGMVCTCARPSIHIRFGCRSHDRVLRRPFECNAIRFGCRSHDCVLRRPSECNAIRFGYRSHDCVLRRPSECNARDADRLMC